MKLFSIASICGALTLLSLSSSAADSDSWLLSYKGKYSQDLLADARATALIRGSTAQEECGGKDLNAEIWANLNGPGEPVEIHLERYVTVHACRAHACHEIALLWADTTHARTAAASVSLLGGPIYITSREFTADTLPTEFLARVKIWLDSIHWHSKRPKMVFCGRNGMIQDLSRNN